MRYSFKNLSLSLKSIALFRCAIALVILIALLSGRDGSDLLAAQLELPLNALRGWLPSLAGLSVRGLPAVAALVKLSVGISSLFLLVGHRTRIATVSCFCCCSIASLLGVEPFPLLDGALLPLLLWSCFLPLGAAYSLDSATNLAAGPAPAAIFSGATVALVVQQCFNYWLPGTLFWHATFGPNAAAASLAGSIVWVIGLFAPLVLFIPVRAGECRSAVVALLVSVHAVALLFLGQPAILHLMAIATWLVYLPSSLWDALSERIATPARRGLAIYYDADCGFCKKMVYVLRTTLILPGTPLRIAQSDSSICEDMETYNSWVIVDWQQNRHYKFAAIAYICSLSPVFFGLAPILRWQPILAVGTRFYETVANNRKQAAFFLKFLKFREHSVQSSQLESKVAMLGVATYAAIHLPILAQTLAVLLRSLSQSGLPE